MAARKSRVIPDAPPELHVPWFISDVMRLQIEQNGSALDCYAGKTITQEGLAIYLARPNN